MDSNLSRICTKCEEKKNISEFYKANKNGYRGDCKQCVINKCVKNAKKPHRKEYEKKYYILNKEKYLENKNRRRKENPGLNALEQRQWRQKNLEKARKIDREWAKKRAEIDPNFKLRTRVRNRVRTALLRKNISTSTAKGFKELIGCDVQELKIHLEKLFKLGMSWDNYGKWHIDHIKPLSLFDLTKEEELKKACNFSNLQPLWAEENIKKGNKYGN